MDLRMDPVQWLLCALNPVHTVCGFFLSWQGAPPQFCEHSIWGHAGFYTMHNFLNPPIESQFKSFLKRMIPFWYQHNTITFSRQSLFSS
jgi:hypothetical protein